MYSTISFYAQPTKNFIHNTESFNLVLKKYYLTVKFHRYNQYYLNTSNAQFITVLIQIKIKISTHWLRPNVRVGPAERRRACESTLLRRRVDVPLIVDITSPSLTPCCAALLPGFT